MPKVTCATSECKHNEEGTCTADEIRLGEGNLHSTTRGIYRLWNCSQYEESAEYKEFNRRLQAIMSGRKG